MTREQALKIIDSSDIIYADYDELEAFSMAIAALRQLERKNGRWVPYLKEGLKWKCSECGSRFTTPFHYCPHCGLKMEDLIDQEVGEE